MNYRFFCQILAFICVFSLFSSVIYAQERRSSAQPTGNSGESEAEDEQKPLPRQFREISLGMGLDDLKETLKKDKLFNFRGDRDVSFLPAREESLVETTGSSFVRRAFFQLRDGELFIMSYTLDTGLMDHYSMFTNLVDKYGQPTFLDPKEALWETEDTLIVLERPLTIKYIDRKVFDDIISESTLIQSRRVKERQEFLDEF
ncbi:MAG: hypothetical protein LBC52_06425 [Treponema sp.]|nr:hypothetical protein [Treponema sp.]